MSNEPNQSHKPPSLDQAERILKDIRLLRDAYEPGEIRSALNAAADRMDVAASHIYRNVKQPEPAPSEQTTFDFKAHLQRQREWSEKTFGPGKRTAGVCNHIRKELIEIKAKPEDIYEWIDVAILALDGAWRAGYQPQQIIDALVAKQTKNEGRKWPDWRTMPTDKAIEHDRSGEPAPAAPVSATHQVVPVSVAKFAAWLIREARQNMRGFDGGELQDQMVSDGVLREFTAIESCGEHCECTPLGFPSMCYQLADGVAEMLAASKGDA